MSDIRVNRGRCRKCGVVIESETVHGFRMCPCGAVGVDGGKEYLRRIGEPGDFEELSEYTLRSSAEQQAAAEIDSQPTGMVD